MFNEDNILQIEFTSKIGDCEIQKVVLFNMMKVSEKEVEKAIYLDGVGYNPNIIIITEEQFKNVFFE